VLEGRAGTYVNGPILGAPGLLTDDPDTSVTFDGSNDHVEIAHDPVWDLTGDLTVEAVVNMTGGGTLRTIVAKHLATTDTSTFELRVQASNGVVQFVQKTTAGTYMVIASSTPLAAGTTYHVAATKTGTTARLYIDGVLNRTATFGGTVATNTRPVRIGTRDGSRPFGGRIDEVAIYDHALAAARIQAHADAS
jgi:hypothetical protein